MTVLHLDVETRSVVDLRKLGAYIYFDHPSTSLWCAAYAFDDEEPKLWWPGEPCPPDIEDHIWSSGIVAAFNAQFERLAWRKLLGPVHGWPVPALEQYRCVMAAGYAMGLPGKLEHAAAALGLEERKDGDGYRIMLQLSQPRRPRKGEDPSIVRWWDDQSKIIRLGEYCQQDVRTEQAVYHRIPPLRDSEQQVWFLDQRANDRGVYIDVGLCTKARKIVRATAERLDDEMRRATDMAVRGVGNVGELIAYVKRHGIDADSVAKDQLANLLMRDDLPPSVRRALEIRQEGSKTSVAKIDAMLARRQADGRMRGNLQYHGAGTGRWAARGAQLQNLPRPGEVAAFGRNVPSMIEDILSGTLPDWLEMLYGPALTVVSECIRGMVTAAPGHKLCAADFSKIEARVIAWLAGQDDKLRDFRAYDRKEGLDLYFVTAGRIFNVPPETIDKSRPEYTAGKVSELALGFQGGPSALAAMAKNYNFDIATAHDAVMSSADPEHLDKAEEAWPQRGRRTGMSQKAWMTAEIIKLAWRDANPRIVQLWRDVEDAAIEAVENPGAVVTAGLVKYRKAGSWLLCQLPSKRCIAYAYPKVVERPVPWGGTRPGVKYWAVDSFSRKWAEQDFYGGLGVENITQAVARDVMAEAMMRVDAAGYKVVLTVHDEVVTEVVDNFNTKVEFSALMIQTPSWAEGLPIAAEGWEGHRYRK